MKKALSILLAFQVLLSSLSFNIGMHFCGEQLQSFSLFDKATPCEHASAKAEAPSCPFHAKTPNKKKGCCDDKEVVIEGQEHLTTLGSYSVDLSPVFEMVPGAIFLLLDNFHSAETASVKFRNYKPPLIPVDIPVFIQTFLI